MGEKLYVLGHPVGHSKSPAMLNAAARELGLDWEYGFADCAAEEEARAFLEARAWRALNVTTPYKPLALAFACASGGTATLEAQLAGGANVLVNWGGAVHAANTDGVGCVANMRRNGSSPEGRRVAVCGTGPTSLSIFHACVQAGAGQVTLLGRDERRAKRALEAYERSLRDLQGPDAPLPAERGQVLDAASYGRGADLIAGSDIIVDATPLGMNPGDPAPFDPMLLAARHDVYDVVYGHGETALLKAARETGCRAFDGQGMLVGQAVETVRFVQRTCGTFDIPEDADLFAVMAQAAGFNL